MHFVTCGIKALHNCREHSQTPTVLPANVRPPVRHLQTGALAQPLQLPVPVVTGVTPAACGTSAPGPTRRPPPGPADATADRPSRQWNITRRLTQRVGPAWSSASATGVMQAEAAGQHRHGASDCSCRKAMPAREL